MSTVDWRGGARGGESVIWQFSQKGSLGENGYMYMYGKAPVLSTKTITTLFIAYTLIQNKKV